MMFDIVTINYNNLLGLKNTIESVRQQKFLDFRHIIVDGKSDDGSLSLINEYSSENENVIWDRRPDKSIYDGMNRGLDHVTSHYVIFLNSGDCFFSSYSLSFFASYIQNLFELEPALVYGDIALDTEQQTKIIIQSHRRYFIPKNICQQAIAYNRKLFEKRRFDTSFSIVADYEFLLYLVSKGKVFHSLGVPVISYEGGGASEADDKLRLAEKYRAVKNSRLGSVSKYLAIAHLRWLLWKLQ